MTESPKPPLRFGAIILAAGASTRMGSPKQLLLLDGQPLVVRAAEAALVAGAWPVVVVLGAHAEKSAPPSPAWPVLVAENASWPEGMAASIRTGITTLGQFSRTLDAALLALCDQPAFSASVVSNFSPPNAPPAAASSPPATHLATARPRYSSANTLPPSAPSPAKPGRASSSIGSPDRVAAVDLPALAHDLDTPADYAAATKPA